MSLEIESALEAGRQREAQRRGRTGAAVGAFTVVALSRRAGGGGQRHVKTQAEVDDGVEELVST